VKCPVLQRARKNDADHVTMWITSCAMRRNSGFKRQHPNAGNSHRNVAACASAMGAAVWTVCIFHSDVCLTDRSRNDHLEHHAAEAQASYRLQRRRSRAVGQSYCHREGSKDNPAGLQLHAHRRRRSSNSRVTLARFRSSLC